VDKVILHFADTADYPVSFQGVVKSSATGAWQTIFDITNNTNKLIYEQAVTAQDMLSFRCIVRSASSSTDKTAQLSEIELLAASGTGIAPRESSAPGFARDGAIAAVNTARGLELKLSVGRAETINLRVLNTQGRVIREELIPGASGDNHTVNLGRLPGGVYIGEISSGSLKVTNMFAVK
jgi:hypothetical protein